MKLLSRFFKEEDGLGTVELVILIAVLVGIALIFGGAIKDFVKAQIEVITKTGTDGVTDATSGEGL